MTITRNPPKPVEPRRDKVKHLVSSQAQHAGLWLDKYLPNEDRPEANEKRDEKPKQRLVKQTARLAMPEVYAEFYKRWQATLCDAGAHCRTATVQGRMVVGLGDESVLETSVRLHHTYGVPYIPGSALKGLAASFARNRLAGPEWGSYEPKDGKQQWKGSKVYEVVFGDTDNAGYITFFDALYVPESGHKNDKGQPQALYPDVITVHHPDYYGNKAKPPADWDSPIPVPFLSATGAYCVALGGPEAWVDVTFDLLQHALREMGVGAKTSSGYGRMALAGKEGTVTTATAQTSTTSAGTPPMNYETAMAQVKPWLNQRLISRFVTEVGNAGWIVASQTPMKNLNLRGFIAASQLQERAPNSQNNLSCEVKGVIEHDGEWFIELDWPKKDKKKGK